jgi:tape measure domain-containing protein
MASLIGSLYGSLTADYSAFQRNLRAAGGVVETTSTGMRRQLGLTERSVAGFQRSVSSGVRPYALISAARAFDTVNQRANLLRGALFATTAAFGGLGAAITSNVISRYLDSFTSLENQIRVVSKDSADLASQIDLVGRVAERSRGSLQATATLYSRIAKARPEDGAIATLRRVETVSKALQLGGATAQEAASAAIQLSQGIASNRLGGEELRAVLETPLGLELAKGIGVTIGKFREMGYAGELTADVILGALDKISNEIDGKFAASVQTIDQALTVVDGKITKFAGSLDDTYGITKLLTGTLISFGDNLDVIAGSAAVAGIALGSAFAGRGIGRIMQGRINAVKSEVAIRKEALALAQQEFNAAKKAVAESNKSLRTQGPMDPRSAIDPAIAKNLAQQQALERKINAERLANTEKQMQARQKLAEVTVGGSRAAVRAADALASAEARVSKEIDQRTNLYKQRTRVNKEIEALSAQTSERDRRSEASSKALNDALRRRSDLTKQIEASTSRVVDARAQVAERTISLTRLETEAEQKAANERLAIRRRLIQLDQEAVAIQSRLATQRSKVGGVSAEAEASARAAMARNSREAAIANADLAANLQKSRDHMLRATTAASSMAIGLGVLRNAGASLIGFLGGPWGVAFTVAIGILTAFGIQSQKAAERVARAQATIAETLQQIQSAAGAATASDQLVQIDAQIQTNIERLSEVRDLLEQKRQEISGALDTAFGRINVDDVPDLGNLITSMQALQQSFLDGKIGAQEFINSLEKLGLPRDLMDKIKEDTKKAITEFYSAQVTVQRLGQEIDNLNGKRATISVDVVVNDPSGLMTPRERNFGRNLGGGIELPTLDYPTAAPSSLRDIEAQVIKERELAKAKKDTAEAIREKAQALYEEYGGSLTVAQATDLAKELQAVEDAEKAGKASKGAAKEVENFKNKIAELEQTASGAFLSDLDRKVLDFADSLKNGAELMRQYIAAINSGDMSKAPAELLRVRDALLQIGAAEIWEGILTKYGTGAQLASRFAEEQAKLAILVEKGAITAGQAQQYWADYISQFGEYEWIDSMADAITNFAEKAITDFDNIGEAAADLAKQLLKIALDMLVLDPFKNWLKGLLASMSGVGLNISSSKGGGSWTDIFKGIGGWLAGLFHSGTMNAQPGVGKQVMVSPKAFAHAPKFHTGNLKGKEMAAVIERGEAVLQEGKAEAATNVMDGLTRKMGQGGANITDARVFHIDARGAQRGVAEEIQAALKEYDKSNTVRVAAGFAKARQRRMIK